MLDLFLVELRHASLAEVATYRRQDDKELQAVLSDHILKKLIHVARQIVSDWYRSTR